jgi:hypothetical protein
MRSTAVVDDLILWHAVGILGLAWLIAAVSMDGLLSKTAHVSLAKPALLRQLGRPTIRIFDSGTRFGVRVVPTLSR